MTGDPRQARVAAVLDAVTTLGRRIEAQRRAPFRGRNLTRTQVWALHLLAHSPVPVTPGHLAGELGVTAGAVTQLVDGLRVEGLVETVAHPDDARSRILRLTGTAASEVREFETDVVQRLLPGFDALSDEELAHLARLLGTITAPS